MGHVGAVEVADVVEDLRGTLANATVVDVLQFLHVAGRTGALTISRDGGDEATVYLSNGNVSHVVLGESSGLDALVQLMGWDHGSFRFSAGRTSPVVSIDASFQASVMEAIRLHDERRREALPEPPERFHARLLGELADLQGVRAAALLFSDGSPAVVAGDLAGADPVALQRAVESTVASGAELGALVGGHAIEEAILAFGDLDVMACPVGERWLVVVTGADAQLGVVRHKTRRIASTLRGRE